MIVMENHGALVVSSSYWGSDEETAGKYYVSVNSGAIRVLVPRSSRAAIEEFRGAEYAILSRGPWPAMKVKEGVEIMWEDNGDSPFCLHLTPESFDLMPGEPAEGHEWVISVWDLKKGKPHKSLERKCYWRRVAKIPCLLHWGEKG